MTELQRQEMVSIIVGACEAGDRKFGGFVADCVRRRVNLWSDETLCSWFYFRLDGAKQYLQEHKT
jgi:hypothetical protein